jgi:hypothetical protein
MSLFRETMRPPTITSDAAVRRYIDLIRAEIEPDPLFRRRLRGHVLNQFVAVREGVVPEKVPPSRAMGRLGRACLYASVGLAMSAGVTMAASQAALPGDPLYGVKIRIEELRAESLPAAFQDDLALHALSERVSELARLADAGRLDEVAALAGPIHDQAAALEALGLPIDTESGLVATQVEALGVITESLPPEAQAAVERALSGAPGLVKAGPGTPATGHGQVKKAAGSDGNGQGDSAGNGAANGKGKGKGGGHGNGNGNGNAGMPPGDDGESAMQPEPGATGTPEAGPSAGAEGHGHGRAKVKGGAANP